MILVVAEQQRGKLHRASWEALAAAQELAADQPIEAIVLGSNTADAASEFGQGAVAAVHIVDSPLLEPYTPDAYTDALRKAIDQLNPTHVVLPHTYRTRDFAPKLAARMDRTLVTDCVGIQRGDTPTFLRPVYQGKIVAEVSAEGPQPHFVSVQIGAYRGDQAKRGSAAAAVKPMTVTLDASAISQKAEEPFQEAKQAVDLSQAERIVAVGRGIKAQEHIALAEKLASVLGAQLAASRPICDSGWLPMERQVGSSGQTVAPKLYVALGISGAIQHVVGMKGARTIVAINKDADAPIFEIADYGIVGDLFEIVPAMIAELEKP
ncbi:MAG TPA: electron transfer flavoprotein subunit alpha/FixB family protein [Vicinamibacterales bacterium]|nr:electron transfer flavoprotein subunit alpha/FixB family protein [Vicinamibacterales bacterium]